MGEQMTTETGTLRYLADAVDHIAAAQEATSNGLLSDHLENAMSEIRKAIRMAAGGGE